MLFSETELVVQMGDLDSDSSCHGEIFALMTDRSGPDLQMNKLLWCRGLGEGAVKLSG